jgi:ring-1,2-phenylacetyl-CoA epoxidase subunit PaaD
VANDGEQTRQSRTPEEERLWEVLQSVKDPEIPLVSLVELGMISEVSVADGQVLVRMLPTFAGCPALDVMRDQVEMAVREAGYEAVKVGFVFDPPWSTDRITPEGLRKLKEFGLALPSPCGEAGATESGLVNVACPFCGSKDTDLESIFGPTLCRAIHYCKECQQSFEQLKPV